MLKRFLKIKFIYSKHKATLINSQKHLNGRLIEQYNAVVGFSDLDKLHQRIGEIQDELLRAQTKRQIILIDLLSTRKDLNNLQNEIQNSKRGADSKYLQLVQQEFEVLTKESELNDHFKIVDQQERDYFSQLQSRINILHDKSRSHTRQWSIISTILGALLGVFGTTINFYFRNNEYRRIHFTLENRSDEFLKKIEKLNEFLTAMNDEVSQIKEFVDPTLRIVTTKNNESWYGFFKRKTVSSFRYCTGLK